MRYETWQGRLSADVFALNQKQHAFVPENADETGMVVIGYDEYEVIRLLDYAALTQEQCAEKMNVSWANGDRMRQPGRKWRMHG